MGNVLLRKEQMRERGAYLVGRNATTLVYANTRAAAEFNNMFIHFVYLFIIYMISVPIDRISFLGFLRQTFSSIDDVYIFP